VARRNGTTGRSRAGETAEQVLRRRMAEQLAVVVQNEARARKGSEDGLHDIRVALRRTRSLAMTFRKLDPDGLDRLDRRIAKLCDRMGAARDLDVWIELLRGMIKAGGLADVTVGQRRAVLALLRRERTRLAAEALTCRAFRRVKQMIRDCSRRRLPVRRKTVPPPETFAARRMLVVRELIAERHRRVGNYSKGPAHDLRRAGRRLRYLSEFFAPRLGPECVRAGHWITKAQAALGKVHDCDSALELSRDLPTGRARSAVRQALKRRRRDQLIKFKSAWRHYARQQLQKAWQKRLEVAAGQA